MIENEENLRYKYRLSVIASDVTNRRLLILPEDAPTLGIEPDELEVAYAVRMSMSIPIFFEPVRHVNPETNEEHVIVDGGMLSNFPVWLFDAAQGDPPAWPTFGMLLVEPKPRDDLGKRIEPPKKERGVGALIDYLKSMAQTMMAAHDRLYIEQADFARTIAIPTLGVGTTEFDITDAAPARAVRVGPEGRPRLPRVVGLRRLRRGVPAGAGASAPPRRPRPDGEDAGLGRRVDVDRDDRLGTDEAAGEEGPVASSVPQVAHQGRRLSAGGGLVLVRCNLDSLAGREADADVVEREGDRSGERGRRVRRLGRRGGRGEETARAPARASSAEGRAARARVRGSAVSARP